MESGSEAQKETFGTMLFRFKENALSKFRVIHVLEGKRMMKSFICVCETSIFWFSAWNCLYLQLKHFWGRKEGQNLLAERAMPPCPPTSFVPAIKQNTTRLKSGTIAWSYAIFLYQFQISCHNILIECTLTKKCNCCSVCDNRERIVPCTTHYVKECLIERTVILNRRHTKVGWQVPFLAAYNSPVLPPGTHLLLDGQLASTSTMIRWFGSSNWCYA